MLCVDLSIHEFSTPRVVRTPRERYTTYYNDLAKYYGVELIEESISQGGQYSAVDLIHPVMEQLSVRNDLQQVGYCLLADWAPDFDSDYSAFGPYIIEQWKLNSKLYSVLDQGVLSPVTCLKLAKHLSKTQKVLILSIEQTTIPRFSGVKYFRPHINGAAGILLDSSSSIACSGEFRILDFEIVESSIINTLTSLIANKFSIDKNDIKKFNVEGFGLIPIYQTLEMLKNQNKPGYYLLIVNDLETEYIGYILVHKQRRENNADF